MADNVYQNRKDGYARLKKVGIALLILVTTVVILTLWSWAIYYPHFLGLAGGPGVGDRANVVGSLFSGLALAGVVLAILLQREELKLQHGELEQTRDELTRTAEAQERSVLEMRRQLNALLTTAEIIGLNSLITETEKKIETSSPTPAGTAIPAIREDREFLLRELYGYQHRRRQLVSAIAHEVEGEKLAEDTSRAGSLG